MSTRIHIQIEFAHPPLHYPGIIPLGILATDHASKGVRNLPLSLPCVTNLYFIVRVIAESVQKSKKMRRAMLTPLSGRVRTWKRGCRLE